MIHISKTARLVRVCMLALMNIQMEGVSTFKCKMQGPVNANLFNLQPPFTKSESHLTDSDYVHKLV